MRPTRWALLCAAFLLCLVGTEAALPDDRVEELFRVGATALQAARESDGAERQRLLDEAIAAFRAILHDRPELERVRLELALAFYLKGEDDLSREHFDRALAGNPPPAVVANIRRYLARIRERRRWTSYVAAAFAEDSNIGAASDAEIVSIFGLPFRVSPESQATSGTGVVLWGGTEYQHPVSPVLRLRAGVDAVRREYAGQRFDQSTVAVHVGPRWLIDARTELSVLATATHWWTGGNPQRHHLGGRVELHRRLSQTIRSTLRASWEDRDFESSSVWDGPITRFSGHASWLPNSWSRLHAALGYDRERAEWEAWRNTTRWGRVGVSLALPYGFTVGGSLTQRHTRYDGRWGFYTPRGVPRRDRTRVSRLTAHNRGWTVYGFSPQIAVVRENRETNAQLYDYRKTRVELLVHREF